MLITKYKKFVLLNILILLIFILIYKNYVDRSNRYEQVTTIGQAVEPVEEGVHGINYYIISNNVKYKLSNNLSSYSSYDTYFDRNCVVSGSLEERKRVRWLIRWVEYTIYKSLHKVSAVLPYYMNIVFYSFLIWLGFFLCMQICDYSWKNSCIYLFSIAFIFQHELSETNFSIIETMLISLAIFASYKKNIALFIVTTIIGVLNRESGLLFILFWFVFNNSDYKIPLFTGVLSVLSLLLINYDIINCFLEPSFFLPTEKQDGQFNLSEVGQSISYLSLIRVIINNLLIPLGISIYFFSNLENKKNPLFYIICLYYLMFIVATPLHHISVKMITIPLIVLLANLDKLTVYEKKHNRLV
jgi:hypothetical protein